MGTVTPLRGWPTPEQSKANAEMAIRGVEQFREAFKAAAPLFAKAAGEVTRSGQELGRLLAEHARKNTVRGVNDDD